MTAQRAKRPLYRRKIPRHRLMNPFDVRRHNMLVHEATVRWNHANKRRRVRAEREVA